MANYCIFNGQLVRTDELKHYGIKGMKWGVRRFRKEDGTLTNAGKKRYDSDGNDGGKKQNLVQRHRNNLVEQYKQRGYSQANAEAAAKRRIRTELVVGAVATVAVAAIATKAATRIGQDYVDKTIKSGKVIQNIGAYKDATFKDNPFFGAVNNHDKKAYGSWYPSEKMRMQLFKGESTDIYNNQIKVTKDIKRASVNNARKIFVDMMKNDPNFEDEVLDTLAKTNYGDKKAMYDYIREGKSKKLYDRFNQALATPQFQEAGIHKKFYSALKDKGYDAILDINDTRYSGYKNVSKSPTIFFNGDKLEKIGARKLSDSEIVNNHSKYTKEFVAKQLAKTYGTYGAAIAVGSTLSNQRKIDAYVEKHPNTTLSDKEILKIVNR